MKTTINPSTLPKEVVFPKEWSRKMEIDRLTENILALDEVSNHLILLTRVVKDCGGDEQITSESIWALEKLQDLKLQFKNDIKDLEGEL